jgi:hypothetical protein
MWAERLILFIVDNGSTHRGHASVERKRRRDRRIVLVRTPIHASWLNQAKIYRISYPSKFVEVMENSKHLARKN